MKAGLGTAIPRTKAVCGFSREHECGPPVKRAVGFVSGASALGRHERVKSR